jgi:hypothetical protein
MANGGQTKIGFTLPLNLNAGKSAFKIKPILFETATAIAVLMITAFAFNH